MTQGGAMQKQMDSAIFYSLAIINEVRQDATHHSDWGTFITPTNKALPHPPISKPYHMPYQAGMDFTGQTSTPSLHSQIRNKIQITNANKQYYRSSPQFYEDSFNLLLNQKITVHRLVEVGVQFGDLSCQLAGLLNNFNLSLDLVDLDKDNLEYAYQNIAAVFPEVLPRVRFFYGDLPLYVKNVLSQSYDLNMIYYQGSYNFNDVVRDLGSTYFVKDKIAGVFVANIHLRHTDVNFYPFFDVALYALFGMNLNFIKLGNEIAEESALSNQADQATFWSKNRMDGMYIPYTHNQFRYPHPSTSLDNFIYKSMS